jgi:hypothetical protein
MTKVQKRIIASVAGVALIAGLFVGFQPIGRKTTMNGLDLNAEDTSAIIAYLDSVTSVGYNGGVLDFGTANISFDMTATEVGSYIPTDISLGGTDSSGNFSGIIYISVGEDKIPMSFNNLQPTTDGDGNWTGYTGTAMYGEADYRVNVSYVGGLYQVHVEAGDLGRTTTTQATEATTVAETTAAPSGPSGPSYTPPAPSATVDAPAADAAAETPAAPVADVVATADGDVDTAAAATFLTEAAAEAVSSGETEVVAEIASDVTVISETAIAELIASVPEDIEVKLESKVETADGKDAGSILIPLAEGMADVKTGVKTASDGAITATSEALGADFVGGFTTAQKGTFGTAVTFSLKASAFGIDVETDLADCELTKSGYKKVYIIVVVDGKASQVEGLINKSGKIVFRTDLAGTYYVSAKPVLES